MMVNRREPFRWRMLLFVLILSVFLGFSIAILPIGATVRLWLPFLVLISIFVAWGFRGNKNTRLRNPLFWLLILTVFLSVIWPRYIFFYIGGLPGINPYTLCILVCLYFGAFILVYSGQVWMDLKMVFVNDSGVVRLCMAFLVWGFFCSLLGGEPLYSTIEFIKESVYLSCFILFGLLLATYKNGPLFVLRGLVFFGFVASLIGVIESFTYVNLFTKFATMEGSKGSMNAVQAIISDKTRDGQYRVQSVFGHPIVFAQFLACVIPLAFFSAVRERELLWRLVAVSMIPLAVMAIVKSGSRSGYFSLAAAFFFIMFVRWCYVLKHGEISRAFAIIFLPAAVAASAVCYFVLGELFVGRSQHEISSTNTRITMLLDGMRALSGSPIFGFGHGMAWEKAGVVSPDGIATIDNYLLTIVLDYGLVGLFLFCAILIVFSIKCIKMSIANQAAEGAFVGACCASLMAMFVTFCGLSTNQNLTFYWLVMAVAIPFFSGKKIFQEKKLTVR
jgi:O-antigen ligase